MPNFDTTMLGAFRVVTNLYGEPATWHTATGGPVAGFGLFNEPTQGHSVMPNSRNAQAAEFEQAQPTFEYATGQFIGLKEAATESTNDEILILPGRTRAFLVGNVERLFDGETYRAILNEILPFPTLAPYVPV